MPRFLPRPLLTLLIALAALPAAAQTSLATGDRAPAFTGVTRWLNSPPLTADGLRGKVLLVDFWTFECINCLHALPQVKALDAMLNYPPTVSVSVLVNSLKGVSSRMIRKKNYPSVSKKLWGGALWSPSYFAGSCGGAPISIIRQYIEQQQTPD